MSKFKVGDLVTYKEAEFHNRLFELYNIRLNVAYEIIDLPKEEEGVCSIQIPSGAPEHLKINHGVGKKGSFVEYEKALQLLEIPNQMSETTKFKVGDLVTVVMSNPGRIEDTKKDYNVYPAVVYKITSVEGYDSEVYAIQINDNPSEEEKALPKGGRTRGGSPKGEFLCHSSELRMSKPSDNLSPTFRVGDIVKLHSRFHDVKSLHIKDAANLSAYQEIYNIQLERKYRISEFYKSCPVIKELEDAPKEHRTKGSISSLTGGVIIEESDIEHDSEAMEEQLKKLFG